ncbi:hypothetical protein N7507_003657 [Penicillium longicatenatum]|nr:hypothetical protein N7507_003657 [Penicillium longicatenatum]
MEDTVEYAPLDSLGRQEYVRMPTAFHPPFTLPNGGVPHPRTLFPLNVGLNAIPSVLRFINYTNPTELLIYTDGSCLGNGG